MEQAGVALIAQGAGAFSTDLKGAENAVNGFVDQAGAGSSKVSAAGEIMVGALRKVGEIAIDAFGQALQAGAAFISGGIADAREANMLLAQTTAVITSTGGAAERSAEQITDLATALSASQGASLFGDSQVQEAENLLLTFTNVKGAVFDAATAMSVDLAQALGGAPKDQAIALGKALNDPIQGVTALTRVGVTFTDQQKEQIKAMQEAGDMAGAQQIILAELSKEFGGSAKAAADADGGMAKFNDSLGEIGESIGTAVLPLLNDFADWLNSSEVQGGIKQFADGAIVAFGWLHDNVPPIIATVRSAVEQGIEFITNIFNNDLQPALKDNQQFFQTTFDSISDIVSSVSKIVQATLAALAEFIDEHGATIERILGNTWSSIKALIDGVLALIQGSLKIALDVINGDWSQAWTDLKDMSARIVTDLGTIIGNGLDNILSIFQDMTGGVQESFSDMVDGALEVGADIVDGILSGLQANWDSLMGWVAEKAKGLVQAALDAIGAGSPAKEFMPVGQFSVQGIMEGFSAWWPRLTDQVADLGDSLVKQAADIGAAVTSAVGDAFGATASIDRQVADNLDKFKDVLPQYQQYTQGALQEAQNQAMGFLDPAEGAKFFKMRSKQILEFAKLQQDLDKATTADERAQIQERMNLINKAQTAEINQFNANAQASQNTTESLIDKINDLFTAFAGVDLSDAQIALLGNLQGYVDQLTGAGAARSNAYANPPMLPPQYANGGSASYSQQSTYNMPIYTNNTPAALQQSWAIMQAMQP